MSIVRLHWTIIGAAAALGLLVGCTSNADVTPAPSDTATATASAAAPGTGAPSATRSETAIPAPSETVASTYFVPTSELPLTRITTADGRTVDLPTEVPPTDEYGVGLSGRETFEGRGMLFYYPGESGGPGFWMRNTHIDLDIAFIAGDGTILLIRQMTAESEEVHHPGRAYLAGLEAPAGWYEANGIREGDRVEFLFDPEELMAAAGGD